MIEKKIEDFDPTNLEFTFNFTKDTCAKLKTGICELDEIDITYIRKHEDIQLRHLSRCQRIYYGLLDKTIKTIPQIMKCKCGHYVCSDGQHRICVAQRMGFKLDVIKLGDISESCEVCSPIINNKQEVTNIVFDGKKFCIIKND